MRRLCLVPHPPLVNGQERKAGRARQVQLRTLGPATPEDPGVGAASPGVEFLGTLAPRIIKFHSKLPASSPSWGLAPTTSTSMLPNKAPPAPSTLGIGATTSHGEPKVTTTRSPMLIVHDAIKGRHGSIVGRATDRHAVGTNEV
jgi:hypothetical protein